MTGKNSIPPYWQEAVIYLERNDAILARLLVPYKHEFLQDRGDPFYTLIRAVVGQQISVKAADAIWARLEAQLNTISPQHFLKVEEDILRQCGLSRQKIEYMRAIASAFIEEKLTPDRWENMSEEEIVVQLVKIKGIGKWTAEMFLIFHLQRPDVLPLTDLGLINAIKLHYGNLDKAEMLNLARQWQPYRTVATWYLWRSLDPVVVQY